MDCAAYDIICSIVRNTSAVIVMVIFALYVVDLALIDENPGGCAEQFFEDFSHLVRSVCGLGDRLIVPLFIS